MKWTIPMSDAYGIRGGEVTVPLPEEFDAGLYFIGRIHTPWTRREDCPKNPREAAAALCTIALDLRFAEGLAGLEGTSHVIVLYWMDRARRDLVRQMPRHLGEARGTFSLRSPARPNPIALSVARLLRIDGTTIEVQGLDCLDGTACIDIKPYFPSIDSVPDALVDRHKAMEE
jgi:tRNA-Thr(GGU) m(6)t(6)A37 methyltransferase TsaA